LSSSPGSDGEELGELEGDDDGDPLDGGLDEDELDDDEDDDEDELDDDEDVELLVPGGVVVERCAPVVPLVPAVVVSSCRCWSRDTTVLSREAAELAVSDGESAATTEGSDDGLSACEDEPLGTEGSPRTTIGRSL
jgi:hypothetical protein